MKKPTNKETPEEHLANHPITFELQRLDVTDEQLQAIQFRSNNQGLPFDQWSFRFPDGIPVEAINLVKPYCSLKWLILDDPPSSREKDDAWRLVSETMAAPLFEMALKHKETQSIRAKNSRGKISENGKTINHIIKKLALNPGYEDEGAKELWRHFYAELDRLGTNPKEIKHPKGALGSAYEYDFKEKRKRITHSQFANVVSKARLKKKSA